jgi:hypothetical protein
VVKLPNKSTLLGTEIVFVEAAFAELLSKLEDRVSQKSRRSIIVYAYEILYRARQLSFSDEVMMMKLDEGPHPLAHNMIISTASSPNILTLKNSFLFLVY